MKHYIKFLLPSFIIFAACNKDIEVKLPVEEPKLVINSRTNVGDTIHVQVTKSMGVLEYNAESALISNATVRLNINNIPGPIMTYDPAKKYYTSPIKAEQGKKYSVTATAPSFTKVEGSTLVPAVVPIVDIRRVKKVRIDDEGSIDELRITFDDPPTPGDYYIVRIVEPLESKFLGNFNDVRSTDASVEGIANSDDFTDAGGLRLSRKGIVVNDALFNGRRKELILYCANDLLEPTHTTDNNNQPVTLYTTVELLHVTNDYYRYFKSYTFVSESYDDGFTQPANVYTNITNGYGIFSIVHKDWKAVQ
ncbi:MAG: DUF4249 domain-containing protein [Taibaiella sp.]|jgi:hypothetical protein